jgi:hypothetical protein
MRQSTRKLLGTVIFIVVMLIVYPLAAMELYARTMMGLPPVASILAFAILGGLWFFPAAWMVRWMAKPD